MSWIVLAAVTVASFVAGVHFGRRIDHIETNIGRAYGIWNTQDIQVAGGVVRGIPADTPPETIDKIREIFEGTER